MPRLQNQNMKKRFLIAITITSMVWIVLMPGEFVHGNSFGAPVNGGKGFTGSPFDNRACNNPGCHSGTLNSGTGTPEILTDIPASGYKAGKRYSITTKITESGKNTFGFQITAETASNHKTGRFIAGSETRAPSDFYVTQGTQSTSTSGNGSRSWTFSWDAPESSGDGPITFFAAFNAANGNGQRSGDRIYTTSLLINEDPLSGIDLPYEATSVIVYPNPVRETLYLKTTLSNRSGIISIYNTSGEVVKKQSTITEITAIEVGELPDGIYMIHYSTDAKEVVRRVMLY